MRRLLESLEIGRTELAGWLDQKPRTIRHYVSGDRCIPPALKLLLEYLAAHPDAKEWFRERAMRREWPFDTNG